MNFDYLISHVFLGDRYFTWDVSIWYTISNKEQDLDF